MMDWPIYLIALLFIPLAHMQDVNVTLTPSAEALSFPSVIVTFSTQRSPTSFNIYHVKLNGGQSEVKTTNVTGGSFTLTNLDFNSEYNVSVTSIVGGQEGGRTSKSVKTASAPLPSVFSDSVVEVLLISDPSATYYEVIVLELTKSGTMVLPQQSSLANPTSFDKKFGFFYLALRKATFNGASAIVKIGDNTNVTINGEVYRNAPLEAKSNYAFFQRSLINGNLVNNPYMEMVTTNAKISTADDGLTSTEIVAIIVGVTAGIIGLLFILICFFNWKYSLRYKPKPGKGNVIKRLNTDPAIPVTKEDFFDHVTQMKLHNFKGFYEEFSAQKSEFHAAEAFRNPDNAHKNRFFNIPCYDYCRVKLKGNDYVSEYIHANFIPGAYSDQEYIVTQAPLPETITDFWGMVWQMDSTVVIMIGELIEKGNRVSASYFPENEGEALSSYYLVKLVDVHKTADYIVRKLKLVFGDTAKYVTHYQYVNWPKVQITPEYPLSFLQMVNRISRGIPERPGKPIVVHGTTGYGRAGIYVCIDSQIQRYIKQNDISIYDAVTTVKKHRHDGVKTLDEYIFIHDAVLEAVLLNHIENIEVMDIPKYVESASRGVSSDLFGDEYNLLTSTTMLSTQKMGAASEPYNMVKNRYSNVKPYDYNRVKLTKLKNEEGSDYINASFITTYGRKNAFIATQAPLVETISDFWRMINETESWVIVLLGQEIENGQLKANRFWPEEGYAMVLGDLTIKFISVTQGALRDVYLRQLELRNGKGERKLIQFYQYHSWPANEAITSQSIFSLVRLVDESEQWRNKLNAKVVTVVSSSGIGRPGVFIGLRSLQEQSDIEGHVNIFMTARKLNQQRTSLVQTRAEYALMYTSTLGMTENARRRGVISEDRIEHFGDDHCGHSVHDALDLNLSETGSNDAPELEPDMTVTDPEIPDKVVIDIVPQEDTDRPEEVKVPSTPPLASVDSDIEMAPVIGDKEDKPRVSFRDDRKVNFATEDTRL